MPVKDVLIRAQELGGRFVVLGSDSARGISVEELVADADTWGSRSATFTLRRNGRVPWPDIGAYAPIEVESQGVLVWSGRVKGTPTTDGADRRITVNAEGHQYHLDDDQFARNYVHTDLAEYKDIRSSLSTNLALYTTSTQIQSETSGVVLTFPKGATVAAAVLGGVTLDFGPSLCKVVTFNWESSNNAAPFSLLCDGHDFPDGAQTGTVETAITFTLNSGASGGTGPLTFTTPRRYVSFIIASGAGAGPLAVDCWIRINLAWTFSASAYTSGNVSVLKASDVVADARARGTLLLSTDTSKIATTTFNIPSLAMTKPATPRDVINAVNAYHNYQARVDVDKRVEYRAQPASAAIQVDARSEFDEASAGDASEIYSSVNVTYTDEANQPQTVSRGQQGSLYQLSLIQPTNPGAETNTTGWAATNALGTLTRTTVAGEFSTGVGAFKLVIATSFSGASTAAWTGGTFSAGQAYRLTFDAKTGTGNSANVVRAQVFVDGIPVGLASLTNDNVYHSASIDWVQPSASTPVVEFSYYSGVAGSTNFWDNLILYEAAPTIVNRRRFRRTFTLDTNMSLTAPAAQQIGDVFLAAHKTTPLKGKVVVSGYGSAQKTPSGVRMPPSELLLNTGELVRFVHLIDPDTGAIGREGRIASVSWDAASDTSTIEIDSQVSNFEAFIARLGILTGAVR